MSKRRTVYILFYKEKGIQCSLIILIYKYSMSTCTLSLQRRWGCWTVSKVRFFGFIKLPQFLSNFSSCFRNVKYNWFTWQLTKNHFVWILHLSQTIIFDHPVLVFSELHKACLPIKMFFFLEVVKYWSADFFRERGTAPPLLNRNYFCLRNWRHWVGGGPPFK